jgi:hypothetical protein
MNTPKQNPDEPMLQPMLLDNDFDEMDHADAEFSNWRWPEREHVEDF